MTLRTKNLGHDWALVLNFEVRGGPDSMSPNIVAPTSLDGDPVRVRPFHVAWMSKKVGWLRSVNAVLNGG